MPAKICQTNGKAIISNPNKDLGEWLLRGVFKFKEDELVTADMFEDRGVNAVTFTKQTKGSNLWIFLILMIDLLDRSSVQIYSKFLIK